MSQPKDAKCVARPDDDRGSSGPSRLDTLGSNQVVHIHTNPIVCSSSSLSSFSTASSSEASSFCKSVPTHSGAHVGLKDDGDASRTAWLPDLKTVAVSAPESASVGEDSNAYDDSEEDRPGSFDYMPSQGSHTRICHSHHDDKAKLSLGSSVLEALRKEKSVHGEAESGVTQKKDSDNSVLPLRTKHADSCWDYMPTLTGKSSEDEDMEEDEDRTDSNRPSGSAPSRMTTQVDECVSYNLRPLNGPSAGRGGHQRLTPSSSYSLSQETFTADGTRDKRSGRRKDDSDKQDVLGPVDVNGNPRLPESSPGSYMRQWPSRAKSENSAPVSLSNYTPIAIPHSYSSSSSDNNAFDRKKERKRMKLERSKGTPAEEFKGHRQFSDINEILAFVEGPKTVPAKGENKPVKKKQERSRKKETQLNGPLALDEPGGGEDGPGDAEAVLDVTEEVDEAMGNNFKKAEGEDSISETFRQDKDVDTNSNGFHDCLGGLPTKLVISDEELEMATATVKSKIGGKKAVKKVAADSAEADRSDSSSNGDNHGEKHLAEPRAPKKKIKNKKKEKPEAISIGQLLNSKPSNPMKPNETPGIQDSSVSLRINSNKVSSSSDKDMVELKREDSFTEVKKKVKRRPMLKDTSASSYSFPSYMQHSGYSNHSNSRSHPHSFVQQPLPFPANDHQAWPAASSQASSFRDLSPSAFPVLSSQAPSGGLRPDARRNSCGDITSDSVDYKTYDSDRESAKSLPAAHRGRVAGDRSPTSWAKIAAGPPKNDSTNSPSSDSGVTNVSHNSSLYSAVTNTTLGNSSDSVTFNSPSSITVTPERKAAVWKGSPRERRHSIGSGPDDVVEGEKPSVAESNRQCGSQEVLSRKILAVSPEAVSGLSVKHKPSSKTTAGPVLSGKPAAVEKIVPPQQISPQQVSHVLPPVSAVQVSAHQVSLDCLKKDLVCTGEEHVGVHSQASSVLEKPLGATVVLLPVPEKVNTELTLTGLPCAASLPATSSVVTESNARDGLSPGVKTQLISHNGPRKVSNSTKSVIFLDKRFDSSPHNLGITFGYDDSLHEPECNTASHFTSHQSASSHSQTALLQKGGLPHHLTSHIPSSGHNLAALSDTSSLRTHSSVVNSRSTNNNNNVPKNPPLHGPCNGLILPSSISGNSSIPETVSCSDSAVVSGGSSKAENMSDSCVTSSPASDSWSTTLCKDKSKATAISSLVFTGQLPALEDSKSSQQPETSTCLSSNLLATDSSGVTQPHQILTAGTLVPRSGPADTDSTSQPFSCHQSTSERCLDNTGASNLTEPAATTCSLVQVEGAKDHPVSLVPASVAARAVVYGLQIKPGLGCGKLMFVHPDVPRKTRANATEAGDFLRKKWLDISNKKGPGFQIYAED